MANVRKSKSFWAKVKKTIVPLMIEYTKNYTEIKALENDGYLNKEQEGRLNYLYSWNNGEVINIVDDIMSALHHGALDLDGFAAFLSDIIDSMESMVGGNFAVPISEIKLQSVVGTLCPGMKVIPEKLYCDVFE